jgi:sterol desaturase/sphingolipid hydroxylase (fatty acid hydroxylase superfamily)
MSGLYAHALSKCHGNDRLFVTLALSLAHTVPAALHEFFLQAIGFAGLFQDRLTQPGKNVDTSLSRSCVMQSIVNHFFVMPLVLWLVYPYISQFHDINVDSIPGLQTILLDIFICVLFEDALFYWSHRALHHPSVYKHFHKKHHEFKVLAGMSLAAEYTHPFESFVGNIVGVVAGPIYRRVHIFTFVIWLVLRMLKTCDAHSGYDFSWSPFGLIWPLNPARRHDFHHETGLGSYGSFFMIWDYLCGTDKAFLAHEAKLITDKAKRTDGKQL